MKKTFLFVLGTVLLSGCASGGKSAFSAILVDSLDTPSYNIDINSDCGIDCNDLTFVVENRTTGKSKTLKGKKIMAPCEEGDKNCDRVVGYEFADGDDKYFITEGGKLTVTRFGKTLLWERGDWEEAGGAGQ
ncbi:hypothetical protein [Methylococcus sp. Mc7]|uniref:hypothetical protein n=1 Tax=Methylococcus sp. Mc7 TaxID=2860258 RepID=UPI001C52DBD6|nr:hypothetical protein [Methylococcus sp. Mc7]QXP84373.1 hypothetical protein KW115_00930 [Methylococcus sp. Mc7]